MFYRLLVPLCLATLARGDHYAEDVPAQEPESLEAEMRPESFEAALEAGSFEAALEAEPFNSTYDQRYNGGGSKVGAHVERVLLRMCSKMSAYLPHFYEGLVVNSRAWKTKGDERFTSVALLPGVAGTVSSSAGAWPSRNNYIFHSWDMLYMKNPAQDIRKHSPGKVYYWTWNAMQQIYIPLWLFNEDEGAAYMLHIYPEPSFLLNPPAETEYTDALVYAKGNTNRMYKLEIDVEGMIKNLQNYQVPDYKKYITSWGVAWADDRNIQSQVAFKDYRLITLEPSTISTSTEGLCGYFTTNMDIGWPELRFILQREFSWL